MAQNGTFRNAWRETLRASQHLRRGVGSGAHRRPRLAEAGADDLGAVGGFKGNGFFVDVWLGLWLFFAIFLKFLQS